ncbi:MAG: polysaccharide biosynthesis protein, partial [Propionibacteriaceae bacterium]
QQILGVWFTLLTVLGWVLNFDLGLGNGLRNRLVVSLAEGDLRKVKKYVSSAYVIVSGLVGVFAASSLVGLKYVDWNRLLNIPAGALDALTLESAVLITSVGFLLQFILRLISSILYALQMAAVTNLLSLITNVIILVVVSTVNLGSAQRNLIMLAFSYAVAVNVPLLGASVIVFATSLRGCAPTLRDFEWRCALDVIGLGGSFFAVQVSYMLIANTDPFLISWLSGPEHVVTYQIYSLPFNLVSSLFALALTPIWSAVTHAAARDDLTWIRRLYSHLRRLAIVTILGLFACAFFLQYFVMVWLGAAGGSVEITFALAFAASASAVVWTGAISSIVNGLGRLRFQFGLFVVGLLVKIPMAFILVGYSGSWIWVVVSDVFALVPYCVIQPFAINRLLRPALGAGASS